MDHARYMSSSPGLNNGLVAASAKVRHVPPSLWQVFVHKRGGRRISRRMLHAAQESAPSLLVGVVSSGTYLPKLGLQIAKEPPLRPCNLHNLSIEFSEKVGTPTGLVTAGNGGGTHAPRRVARR